MNEPEFTTTTRTDPELEHLEQRLHRLESAVASLQDTRALEERVTEKVRQRLQPGTAPAPVKVEEKVVDSKRHAITTTPAPTGDGKVPAVAPDPPVPLPVSLTTIRRTWLLIEMWRDLVAIVRMFFDVRYHVGWFPRLAVLILVPAILTSQLWLPMSSIPVVGPIFDKIVNLLLAFFLYQALSREASRYQLWKAQNRKT